MKACCAAVSGTCAAGGLFLVYDGADDPRDAASDAACRPGIAAVPPRWPWPVALTASGIMPGTATTACVPRLPARPAVPAILAVPFLPVALRARAARPALAVRLLRDVSAAVPVPGTAALPDGDGAGSAWLTALSSSPL